MIRAVMTKGHIIGIGGAHFDWIAQKTQSGPHGASTPGEAKTFAGGCCLNTLRVLAQLLPSNRITMISARGGDAAGSAVQAAMEEAGLEDQSAVFLDRTTPTYTAILNADGDVEAAVADMALYETALPRHLRRLEVRQALAAAEVLVIDANLPGDAIKATAEAFDGLVVALAISPAKAERLRESARCIDLVFMNHREQAGLGDFETMGLKNAVITAGSETITIYEDGTEATISPGTLHDIVDVTGAGDALAGATLAARLTKPALSLPDAVTIGVKAAHKALQTPGPLVKINWDDLRTKADMDGQ
ncbi:MAG: PfkB family carbohydrate kinase [Pseudomonadota bacterium]